MLPFGVTIPATVPQGSEIPEGLMNKPVYKNQYYMQEEIKSRLNPSNVYYNSVQDLFSFSLLSKDIKI
jgi:hypothetical protein